MRERPCARERERQREGEKERERDNRNACAGARVGLGDDPPASAPHDHREDLSASAEHGPPPARGRARVGKNVHPGDNPGKISHRCHPILVAFVWELTKETIDLCLGCFQGGCVRKTEILVEQQPSQSVIMLVV